MVVQWALLAPCFATYLIFVRVLRYRRVNSIVSKFSEDAIRNMTPHTAQKIVHESFLYDTPAMMLLGTQVALFKVYGISSIASILLKTGVLSSTQINKRLSDTTVLIATALSNPIVGPGSGCPLSASTLDPRGSIAIARMNYLHGKYPIKNGDFLYMLSLFMIEPIRKTEQFDWRPHSPLEIQAIFVLWSEIGRRMGMTNIWESYDEMVEWSTQYEIDNMVPTEASKELARIAIGHYMIRVPTVLGLRRAAYQLVLTVLDQRTRTAMGLPNPSPLVAAVIFQAFKLRAFFARHLCLPRKKPALWVRLDSVHIFDKSGIPRIPAVFKRRAGPWYYPEETGWALTIQQIKIKLGILDPNKVPNKRWKSEGYRLEELGPSSFENQGHDQVMQEASKIHGHPITGLWGIPARTLS